MELWLKLGKVPKKVKRKQDNRYNYYKKEIYKREEEFEK